MAWAPMGPSTSRTSNRWPVARPMLAWGWLVHQASTRARLVVASLTPWGTRLPRGCLAGWPQPGSRHEQPDPLLYSAAAGRWEPAGGRRGGGAGSAGAGPGCPGRHSRGRRRATAHWAGSWDVFLSWWALALQEAGGAAAAAASGLGQGAGRPGLAVRPWSGISRLQPHPDCGGVGRSGPGGQRRPPGAAGRGTAVPDGRGVASSDAGGFGELAGSSERAQVIQIGGLGGQAGDL